VAGGLAAHRLLFDFGRTFHLTASSKLQALAENQNANATRAQVLLQVNTGYFGALGAQAVLRVAQQTVDTRQLLLDQVTLLASNKLKSELDVSFARVAVEASRLLLQQAQNNNADDAMTSLSTALGHGRVTVLAIIQPDKATVLHLDRAWRPPASLAASAIVRFPDGEAVGWSSSFAKLSEQPSDSWRHLGTKHFGKCRRLMAPERIVSRCLENGNLTSRWRPPE
jgi:outer membrane protein TolC